eukprot:TRINITY_DN2_c0_g1_i2.p1 TRINITY_DN2_c0_g1~~TRINITY_DN2_c0_g1_i2.p1  ORF type:complete len:380 (+),score=129.65 TRINITY_DN2_c0_g1_i2:79-1140(+)
MGKKTEPEAQAKGEAKKANDDKKEEEEDTQIIKDLKALDDKYLAIEKEYEKELQELQKKFEEKQQPLLEERTKVLKNQDVAENEEDKSLGTPAVRGFWVQALQNHPAFEDSVEEWDMPVLEYCSDITKSYLDDTDFGKGFKITMHFVENPYFTNTELWKEYHSDPPNPYNGDVDITEIKSCEIEWQPGKDVTVEKVSKKVKGGGAKKAKQKGKEKEEPRDSFFRAFFRSLKPGEPIPDDVNMENFEEMMDEDDDEDALMEMLMDNDYEMGTCLRDQLIPFAVRWYTGEASPEDDDDDFDEDGEEEDDDDDDEDDDESDEDEPPAKGGKTNKKKQGGGGKGEGKGGKQEECKQQ